VLFLLLELDGERYALDSSQLIEVLPLVDLKPLSRAPQGIAGMFDYHGVPVPVVDLSEVILGRAAKRRLNTRIVIVNYPGTDSVPHALGLVAERATATVRLDPAQFKGSGVSNGETAYLGPVARDAQGLIQWLAIPKLLPLALRNVLFQN
jgi:chemotaxis-related protein WspB